MLLFLVWKLALLKPVEFTSQQLSQELCTQMNGSILWVRLSAQYMQIILPGTRQQYKGKETCVCTSSLQFVYVSGEQPPVVQGQHMPIPRSWRAMPPHFLAGMDFEAENPPA